MGEKKRLPIGEAIRLTATYLQNHGIPQPRLEAEVLLGFVLKKSRVQLYTAFDQPLEPGELDAYRKVIRRRVRGVPVAYLTGRKEFMGLEFAVNPAVLIPRPETEILVEEVVNLLKSAVATPQPVLVDVGTGSGAIAVSCAKMLPGAQIYALDVSAAALEVAAVNAARHGVADRITLLPGDLLDPLEKLGCQGKVTVIAANLPYLPRGEIPRLQQEVRLCEPHLALDGGEDGLDLYRRLVPQAVAFLSPGGYLVCEMGMGQEKALGEIFRATAAFADVYFKPDYAGITRIIIGRARQRP